MDRGGGWFDIDPPNIQIRKRSIYDWTRPERIVSEFDDVKNATTKLHDLIALYFPHDVVRFYPKYHCELSPIERYWAVIKRWIKPLFDSKAGIKQLRY